MLMEEEEDGADTAAAAAVAAWVSKFTVAGSHPGQSPWCSSPCAMYWEEKMSSDERCNAPSDFSSSSSSSSAPFSPLRSRMQVWSLCRKRGEKKKSILHNQERETRRSTDSAGVVTMRA
ncbi:hypothetical protein CHARACLAT_022989 [Characodon lateralis]|uniref:Uncharacterized protein n=1 Tax=Characodon lateralis TaxID=208331 RepID=A0ABU7F5N4_9TELE|nr:hypothetical protein [Characodon lateralis]